MTAGWLINAPNYECDAGAIATRAAVDRAYALAGLKENFERARCSTRQSWTPTARGLDLYLPQAGRQRALALIGKVLGMFIDRKDSLSSDET
jgi:hypothetical protein